MQFHVEVLALPFVDAVSAILCAACLAPAHLSCSWCRYVPVPALGFVRAVGCCEQHLLLRLVLLLLLFLLEGC